MSVSSILNNYTVAMKFRQFVLSNDTLVESTSNPCRADDCGSVAVFQTSFLGDVFSGYYCCQQLDP